MCGLVAFAATSATPQSMGWYSESAQVKPAP
jgi:hypothetical protein